MHRLAALLIGLVLLAPALPAAQGAERAEAVLADLAAHGYASPDQALQRLKQASSPPANAPLALRWELQAALSAMALHNGDEALLQQSLAALQQMVEREDCRPCAALLTIRRSQAAEGVDAATLRQRLDELRALPDPSEPWMRFERHRAIATGWMGFNDAEAAVTEALKAVEIAGTLQRPADLVVALQLLGNINATRRDLPKAIEHTRRSVELAREIGFGHGLLRGLFNLSYALAAQKENPERKAVLQEALVLTETTAGLAYERQNVLINLAALSNDIGEHQAALDYAGRAERESRPDVDPNGQAFALVNRGVALVRLGRADEGLALVQKAVEIGERTGIKRELADLLEQQVDALESAGRAQPALRALRRWVQLNTELTSSAREQAIAQLQERVAAQQRLSEIERLRLVKARSDAELQLRTWRERAWAGAALLVALLAVLAWRGLRRSRQQNRRLRGDVQRLADESLHDALTGAWNRRYGEGLLQQLDCDNARLPAAQRRSVALLMLDVDHFKRVNDGYGHAAGDAVLVELTQRLQRMLRQGDAIVRWGGEEFLLVLPETGESGLQTIAGRLLAAIGEAPVPLSQDRQLAVRASAGAVLWAAGSGSPWAEQLALADAALYRAKAEGRNRLIVALPERPLAEAELEQLDSLQAQGLLRLLTVPGQALD